MDMDKVFKFAYCYIDVLLLDYLDLGAFDLALPEHSSFIPSHWGSDLQRQQRYNAHSFTAHAA